MNQNIYKELGARNEFIIHLEKDLAKSDKLLEEGNKDKDKLEELVENIKTLGLYPEHEALIPLSKNIYMKGRIVHTGEFYIKKKAHPDSYVTLQTLESTLKYLESKRSSLEDHMDKAEYAKYQLEERMKVLLGKSIEEEQEPLDESLPKEIKSDKGVAVRVGDFYEILEFEENS